MAVFSTLLPIALGIIMFGLGLSLTVADFRRVVSYPRAVMIGLVCQMLLLPLVCFGIAVGFNMIPVLAVGLMLLAASPGGATSNAYSHLSGGDVALNITITAINSLLTLITLPLIVGWSLDYFMGTGRYVPMQTQKIVEVFAIVLVPVGLGMLLRANNPSLTARLERPVRIISAINLVLIIAYALYDQRDNLIPFTQQAGLPVLVFNLASLGVGYFVPRAAGVPRKQAIALGMEIGIHNGTLAIFIAVNVLQNEAMMVPSALYGILMFFTAAAFGWLVNRKPVTAEE